MTKKKRYFEIAIIAVLVIAIIVVPIVVASKSAPFQRRLKSFTSEYGGGINRTITVYDYSGNEIKSWSGKFDVESNESKVLFDDENGKRVIIYNGIVINEEN